MQGAATDGRWKKYRRVYAQMIPTKREKADGVSEKVGDDVVCRAGIECIT